MALVREYDKYQAGQTIPAEWLLAVLFHTDIRLVRSEFILAGKEEEVEILHGGPEVLMCNLCEAVDRKDQNRAAQDDPSPILIRKLRLTFPFALSTLPPILKAGTTTVR